MKTRLISLAAVLFAAVLSAVGCSQRRPQAQPEPAPAPSAPAAPAVPAPATAPAPAPAPSANSGARSVEEYKRDFAKHLHQTSAELMGSSKVNLYHEHVLVKEPGTREKTPWHHDQPYYPIDGEHIVSFWIPLDPVEQRTCPEYIAGSHRWGRWFRPARFADQKAHATATDGRFESIPDFEAERARHHIVSWQLAPGDCIAFHGLTVHGAPENLSTHRRRAFSARFTGQDARFVLREGFMSPPPPTVDGPVPGAAMDSKVFPVLLA